MQPTLCSRCHKNVAVIFIQKIEGGSTKSEGLCLKCAREIGIKPVEDMMQKMGITDEDLEGLTHEMMSAFGGAEGMEGLVPQEDEGDSEDEDGKTATFPFLNKLFGSSSPQPQPPEREGSRPERGEGKEKAKSEKPPKRKFLENYCISLTQKAADGKLDGIIGREEELQRTIQILNRRQKNNPCLIGEPGVGKTAIAEGLAMRIQAGEVPYKLLDKEVYLLDLTALVAGTQFRGQFESRMKGLKILQGIAPYYERFHFVSISPEMSRLAVTMSERYITDRFLPDKAIDLIDEACSDVNLHNKTLARTEAVKKELDALGKEREDLMVEANERDYKRQTSLKNNEQRQSEIRRELNKLTAEHETLTGNPATQEALKANEHRQASYQRELASLGRERDELNAQEDSGKDYERLAAIKSREVQLQEELEHLDAQSAPPLTVEHLARVIELWTKIPASQIQEAEYERLAKLEDRLKEHLIGQDEAVKAVAGAVRRGRVGIASKRKPVSFIFVGSTGVGKTELVKQLAMDMFHSPEALIRLDMSEFMEKFAVSRIIGSPPGYVGYDEAGQLTEKVRRKPYCVVLFDEIEKAHPDILNILLQILDDGHITDAQGRNVNFENTVIVMTSNAGSDSKSSAGSVGFGRTADEQGRDRAMKALESFLRPEFINRVDEIVYFNKLSEDSFKAIATIMLGELRDNLQEKGIRFTWDEAVLDHLVKASYSQTYGARNLRRQIQKDLEDQIATRLIDGYLSPITSLSATAGEEQIQVTAQ